MEGKIQMNTPQIFNFEQNEVRTMIVNDIPFFVANDVAKTLGYKNPSKATNDHCKKSILTRGNDSLGRLQEFKIIPESDVYRLVIKSKLPNAEKFEEWVMEEVLPQIRKTGSYSSVPQTFAQALRLAADLEEQNQVLEQQLLEAQPKLNYLDIILSSKDTVTITQIAADYGMSAREMNKVLHKLGIQHKVGGQWILYKKHMRKGYTKSHTNEIPKADGGMKVVMNTKWTQKGRIFLYNYLKDSGYYPQIDLEVDESA